MFPFYLNLGEPWCRPNRSKQNKLKAKDTPDHALFFPSLSRQTEGDLPEQGAAGCCARGGFPRGSGHFTFSAIGSGGHTGAPPPSDTGGPAEPTASPDSGGISSPASHLPPARWSLHVSRAAPYFRLHAHSGTGEQPDLSVAVSVCGRKPRPPKLPCAAPRARCSRTRALVRAAALAGAEALGRPGSPSPLPAVARITSGTRPACLPSPALTPSSRPLS